MIRTGLRHVVDFQDAAYGHLYLDRLADLAALDRQSGGEAHGYALTTEAAKYLAKAMAYDDVIRVADLKTRSSRAERVRKEVGLGDDQVMHVTEFMHPRVEEICGAMPAGLGRWVEARPGLTRIIDRLFNKGRHIRTDSIRWFVAMYALVRDEALPQETLAPRRRGATHRRVARRISAAPLRSTTTSPSRSSNAGA